MTERILVSRKGDVTTLTLNRPDDGNRVSTDMGHEFVRLFALAAEDGSKAIVLRGNGADFCLGRDSAGVAAGKQGESALEIRARNADPALAFYDSFLTTPVPIIGAVQGLADGMGAALAALCDITVAADTARFRVPEMERDIPPALVMTAFRDRVPRKAIGYLVWSRDEIDAMAARECGIVNRVVPEAALDAEVDALTGRLEGNSMESIRMIKEYLNNALGMERGAAISYASNLMSATMSSK
ncbi:MAG: enoyl-CoA hydratase/isomerase family protein [Alphaproteobacteria bacterium]|jgi:enoyl-CoA hydratase